MKGKSLPLPAPQSSWLGPHPRDILGETCARPAAGIFLNEYRSRDRRAAGCGFRGLRARA